MTPKELGVKVWVERESQKGIYISCATYEEARVMEQQEKEKLWTNEEVFDMLYKTDKFLMVDLRKYWKTIEK